MLEPARPAATILLVRDDAAALQVLMIERARTMRFAGGASAFPGGKVDTGDIPDGPFAGFDTLSQEDAAARIAAARELFEECGLLLTRGPTVPQDEIAPLRAASSRHELTFGQTLSRLGQRLDAAAFRPFARWLPPEVRNIRRYDTRFYLATAESLSSGAGGAADAADADGHEAVRARWARPGDILSECRAGTTRLLFPTRCNVERLALYANVATALADPTPPPFVRSVLRDGMATIPEGIGYPYTREPLPRSFRPETNDTTSPPETSPER